MQTHLLIWQTVLEMSYLKCKFPTTAFGKANCWDDKTGFFSRKADSAEMIGIALSL